MAAYAALVSLSQITHLNRYQGNDLFSIDAEEKISSIHEYVVYLQSFLEDFPEKAKRWEGRIRDLAHEAEDIIEDLMSLRIQTRHEGRRALPNLEQQLQNVTEKLGLIAGDVIYEGRSDLPAAVSSSSRLAAIANDAIIGLEDDVKTIWHRLCGELSNHLQVIPIVGMGGIGKTTLARTVYDHPSISDHFDFHAWITVSQDYNSTHSLRKILLGLLESMNLLEELVFGQKIDGSDVDVEAREDLYKKLEKVDVSEMELKVFQNLKYRRYLIVMDDVWSTEVLDDVGRILPDEENGSRLMVTTRLSDLASYLDSNSPLHEMRVMNDAQSWNLLTQKVFTNGDCPHELEDVGKEIAKSCAGLPLAVVLVAGLLSAVNSTRPSWEEIAGNVKLVVGRGSEEILSLSYTHLPHHLKPCFLYLGGFPEDENIRASRLIKLWEAEGFLKYETERDKSLEEKAEEYLEVLVKRNLVFVNSRKINGKIRSCSLHDMVRDLCIRKAMEEKFLHVRDGRTRFDSQDLMDERRVSLRYGIDSLLVPTIRTILCFNLKQFSLLLRFLGRFRLLRVFHNPCINPQEFSSQVFELIHLRYLALHGLNITSTISKLLNLETLIIHPAFGQRKRTWRDHHKYASRFALPSEIWRMQQLKHLIFYINRYTLPHPPESNLPLINLQTLSLIESLVWSEKMVEMIPNVKTLGLVYTIDRESHLEHLRDLLQLEKLKVIAYGDYFWVRQHRRTFPRTLKKLSLAGGGFPWEDMSIIGSLPNLQVLNLRDYACYGETWKTGDDEFPQLKYLQIEKSSLQLWITESSSFLILERLVLCSCRDLQNIPEEIGDISTLEVIQVGDCRESVVESAKQIKEYQRSCGNDALQLHCVE